MGVNISPRVPRDARLAAHAHAGRRRGPPAATAPAASRGPHTSRAARPARDHALEGPRSHAAPGRPAPRRRRGGGAPLRRRVRVALKSVSWNYGTILHCRLNRYENCWFNTKGAIICAA